MQSQRNGVPMLAASGYVSQVDETLCKACGECVDFCQFGALSIKGYTTVDFDLCMGCGVCVSKCAQTAISLKHDSSKGEPLEIHKLMAGASQTDSTCWFAL
jgi:heterodisulfide reductase subunit A-like polyferredoxin